MWHPEEMMQPSADLHSAQTEGGGQSEEGAEDGDDVDFEEVMAEIEEDDEAYLGEATLAKLRSGDLDFVGDDDDEDEDDEESDATEDETESEDN